MPSGRSSPELAEEDFLRGLEKRMRDLRNAMGMSARFLRGFHAVSSLPLAVTVFGSAGFGEPNPQHKETKSLGGGEASPWWLAEYWESWSGRTHTLNLMFAAADMSLSFVSVILNALRLRVATRFAYERIGRRIRHCL